MGVILRQKEVKGKGGRGMFERGFNDPIREVGLEP